MTIEVGDEVRISGLGVTASPWMVVESIYPENQIADCIWFNKDNNLQRVSFKLALLYTPKI